MYQKKPWSASPPTNDPVHQLVALPSSVIALANDGRKGLSRSTGAPSRKRGGGARSKATCGRPMRPQPSLFE